MRDVAEDPLLDYGGLNPIPRFLEGRSDAACRVVIPLYAFPVDAYMGVYAGRRHAPQCLL